MGKLLKWGFGFIAVIFVIGVFAGRDRDSGSSRGSTASMPPQQTVAMTPEQIAARDETQRRETAAREEAQRRRDELLRQPEAQRQFVAAVQSGQAAFRAAGRDEFAQGATRPTRRQAICALPIARNPVVRDWVGQISSRTTNNEGRGVLGVSLAPDINLKTWNNNFSDISHSTLIEPGSNVFNAMGGLRNGDWVRVSGRLFQSDTDCLTETSMTIRGTMTSPDFLFRFTELRKIELP